MAAVPRSCAVRPREGWPGAGSVSRNASDSRSPSRPLDPTRVVKQSPGNPAGQGMRNSQAKKATAEGRSDAEIRCVSVEAVRPKYSHEDEFDFRSLFARKLAPEGTPEALSPISFRSTIGGVGHGERSFKPWACTPTSATTTKPSSGYTTPIRMPQEQRTGDNGTSGRVAAAFASRCLASPLERGRGSVVSPREASVNSVADEISSIRKELSMLHMAQGQALSREAGIMAETKRLVKAEREARMQDSVPMRREVDQLQMTLQRVVTQKALTELVSEEHEDRCRRDAELNAKIQRESAAMMGCLEARCLQMTQDIDRIESLINEQITVIAKSVATEQDERNSESTEIRAILDEVWRAVAKQPASESKQRKFFKYADATDGDRYKEVVGDKDDINTLYDMVRETMGDQVRLSSDLQQERALREKVSIELDTLKALAHQGWSRNLDCVGAQPQVDQASKSQERGPVPGRFQGLKTMGTPTSVGAAAHHSRRELWSPGL